MAYLVGFGRALPERVVANEELAPLLGVEPEWILTQSGIRERRYAAEDETVATLGAAAARDCLSKAGVRAEDVGLVLLASGSSERFCPGPAGSIASLLGLSAKPAPPPAIDLPIASAGSLAAMVLGSRLAASMGPVLVVGSEIMSRRIAMTPEGRNTAILFGDGAGAVLISPDAGFARVADSCLHTDGSAAELLGIADGLIHMDGPAIIRHASRKMPQAIAEVLSRNGIEADAVGAFLLHQANLNLIARIAQTVKAPAERFFANIERYGNTSSASMLIAASEWREAHPDALDEPVVFAAFGVGLTWGALLALPE